MNNMFLSIVTLNLWLLAACQPSQTATPATTQTDFAVVKKVKVSGSAGNYSFAVTLQSPDTGCNQYANWWEVLRMDGTLVYRRILAHSHVNEQPFTRSGGGVTVMPTDSVLIRAHMNTSGYGHGNLAMVGTVAQGFSTYTVPDGLFAAAEKADPQPQGCAF